MKVKKYQAVNMTEALKQIRQELGDDAVILNSKFIQSKGFLGFFKKKKIEVIAAIDKQIDKRNPVMMKEKKPASPIPPQPNVLLQNLGKTSEENLSKNEIAQEVAEIKKMVQGITLPNASNFQHYPDPIRKLAENLEEQDLETAFIRNLCEQLLEKWRGSKEAPTEKLVNTWAKESMTKKLALFNHGGISETRKFVNLVGPTGVGKTTTLAKIAAGQLLENKKKIAFITTDTYRIAAIEQLKTYANLLNVPVEVVYKLDDFHKAIEKFSTYDLVFIDTAGRNYRDNQFIEELKNLIDFNQDIETYLTLSVTMKEKDVADIVRNFESIQIDKFIFTKLDETSAYGSLINLILKHGKGVAYLTNGQDVPDDIEIGSSELLVQHLFEGIEK